LRLVIALNPAVEKEWLRSVSSTKRIEVFEMNAQIEATIKKTMDPIPGNFR
jgi:hypothetical protein